MEDAQEETKRSGRAALALAALGIVFGDIGTSPIYSFRECFRGEHAVAISPENVMGALSLVFWALVVIISVKYLVVVLRADNDGEGGILALMALVTRNGSDESSPRPSWVICGLVGAALLFGDAMITPAISVMSALEGFTAENPALQPVVLPGSILILVGLFAAQRHGTERLGGAFGPMMLVWFAVLGVLGALQIAQGPAILAAVSPHHAVMFFAENGLGGLGVLGSVFLVVTGGEALYADLGHFGRRPIQWGWFGLVLPALLLNYFGQGSLLLREPDAVEHLFYRMAPDWFLTPLVIFATYATVIASQAVITGICSLASQAVQLGYSPRLAILQTSSQRIGQIYVPSMNRVLLVGTLLLLVSFRSSGALASAYGIAVASTMLLTTVLVFPVVRERWGWSRIASVAMIGAFLVPDVSFFVANLTKLDSGGWVPIAIAAVVYGLMAIWQSGRSELGGMLHEIGMPDDVFLAEIRTAAPLRVTGTAVYLTARRTGIPRALLHGYGAVHVLHESVLIVRVEAARIPVVPEAERVRVEPVGEGILRAHVRYGFSEAADLPAILARIDPTVFRLDPLTTTYFLARENLVVTEDSRNPLRLWSRRIFAFLSRNALDAARFFRLPPNRVIEIGVQIQI